jgi:hypothetical protein
MISVVICTHNPRSDYLQRVLAALKEQTLPKTEWELLLVDNASASPLAENWDLAWHPQARIVRENTIGLTHARLCGIQNTIGDLIVFVDDDNLLAPDYLEHAIDISRRLPFMGAYNGSIKGEFEKPPPSWAEFMLPQLAVYEVKTEEWVRQTRVRGLALAPCGAGLVCRRDVALNYFERVAHSGLRAMLGRTGSQLSAGEDTDLALCACEMGFAIGIFPQLLLTHLIPSNRFEASYLLSLAEGMRYSHVILAYIWEGDSAIPTMPVRPCRIDRLVAAYKNLRLHCSGEKKSTFREQVIQAQRQGELKARDFLLNIQNIKFN